jgi:hypothetical protein
MAFRFFAARATQPHAIRVCRCQHRFTSVLGEVTRKSSGRRPAHCRDQRHRAPPTERTMSAKRISRGNNHPAQSPLCFAERVASSSTAPQHSGAIRVVRLSSTVLFNGFQHLSGPLVPIICKKPHPRSSKAASTPSYFCEPSDKIFCKRGMLYTQPPSGSHHRCRHGNGRL